MSESIVPSPINPQGRPSESADDLSEQRQELAQMIQWLTRLTASEDFARFLAFVRSGAKACLQKGSDIDGRELGTRDAYMQRFSGLNAMAEWPSENLAAATAELRELDAKLARLV